MLDDLGWSVFSQIRQDAGLILLYKIINGLAEVLIKAYKGTRRKHNNKCRLIIYFQIVSTQTTISVPEAPSVPAFRCKLEN